MPSGSRATWDGRLGDALRESLDGAKRCIQWRCHRSGEKAARAARGEKVANSSKCLGRGLHHVVAGRSMNMHVEECGSKRGAGKIENVCVVGQFRRSTSGD